MRSPRFFSVVALQSPKVHARLVIECHSVVHGVTIEDPFQLGQHWLMLRMPRTRCVRRGEQPSFQAGIVELLPHVERSLLIRLRIEEFIHRVGRSLVADLLILDRQMPRSLLNCYEVLVRHLDLIADASGRRGPSQRLASNMLAKLSNAKIEEIFGNGLHEFVTEFITDRTGNTVRVCNCASARSSLS